MHIIFIYLIKHNDDMLLFNYSRLQLASVHFGGLLAMIANYINRHTQINRSLLLAGTLREIWGEGENNAIRI